MSAESDATLEGGCLFALCAGYIVLAVFVVLGSRARDILEARVTALEAKGNP